MQQAEFSTSFAQLIQQEHPTVTPSYGQQRRHVALHKLSLLHFHALHLEPQTTTRKAISSISTLHNDSMLEYIAWDYINFLSYVIDPLIFLSLWEPFHISSFRPRRLRIDLVMEHQTLIFDSHVACTRAFDNLLSSVSQATLPMNSTQLRRDAIRERDRYQLWARNVGASSRKYKFSLDYRLRDALLYQDKVRNKR